MKKDKKIDERKYERIRGTFIVYYNKLSDPEKVDISQTHDIGAGGFLFTTAMPFEKGDLLKVKIKLPCSAGYVSLRAEVIESVLVAQDLLYDTRIKFLNPKEEIRNAIRLLSHYAPDD